MNVRRPECDEQVVDPHICAQVLCRYAPFPAPAFAIMFNPIMEAWLWLNLGLIPLAIFRWGRMAQ
jgi:hypothetical protein